MTVVTILKITQVPAGLFDGAPTQTAKAAFNNGGDIRDWSVGGITAGADVQTYLNANADNIWAEAVANNAPTMTQGQVDAGHYAWIHVANKDTIYLASYTLEVAVFGFAPAGTPAAPTVAAYRSALNGVLTAMAPIAGTQLDTHFRNEIAAQGLPALSPGVGSYTLAQCAAMDNLMRCWFSAFKVNVLIAEGM